MKNPHQEIEQYLKNALQQDRLAHCYLFLGPEGVGKFSFALRFAQALNCETGNFPPCEKCPDCVQTSSQIHPDLHILSVQADEKQIKIEQVRGFQAQLSYRAFQGKWKVGIIRQAEKLTVQAMNALLKTLEEPPKSTILILTSSNRSRLLPTVVSRCQTIRFPPLKEYQLIGWLKEEKSLPEEKARIIASYSEGSQSRAEEFLNFLEARKRFLKEWLELKSSGYKKNFDLFQERSFVQQTGVYLDFLLNWYRDLIRIKLKQEPVFNPDFELELKTEAEKKSLEEILSELELLLRLEQEWLNYNILAQSLGEQIVLKLS